MTIPHGSELASPILPTWAMGAYRGPFRSLGGGGLPEALRLHCLVAGRNSHSHGGQPLRAGRLIISARPARPDGPLPRVQEAILHQKPHWPCACLPLELRVCFSLPSDPKALEWWLQVTPATEQG